LQTITKRLNGIDVSPFLCNLSQQQLDSGGFLIPEETFVAPMWSRNLSIEYLEKDEQKIRSQILIFFSPTQN